MSLRAFALLAIVLFGGLGAAWDGAAEEAQKRYRIGWLDVDRPSAAPSAYRETVRQALVGYINVHDLAIEERYAAGQENELPSLAAQLVRSRVDVILAIGAQATVAAKQATTSIPIVMVASDAVAARLIRSLAEPGANVTGVTYATADLLKRWLQVVKELRPTAQRVAVLHNPTHPASVIQWNDMQEAARPLRASLQAFEVGDASALARVFAAMTEAQAEALIVPGDSVALLYRRQIVELTKKSRLPAVYAHREFTDVGGLIAYGPNLTAMYRRAGGVVGKILTGAKPRDLPVEQPSRFELIINLKAARDIGLAVPQSLLVRADEVIR